MEDHSQRRPLRMSRWLVTYKDSTPTEIVAGFTTALAAAHTAGPDAFLTHRDGALAALDVGTPLAAAGWSHRFHDTEVSFHSPDHLAEVYLQRGLLDHAAEMQGTRERWLTLAGPPANRWYGTASSFTPHHLVTAMHTALTDPAPVLRYHDDLRRLPPQATATAVKPPVPTPLEVRWTLAATVSVHPCGPPPSARGRSFRHRASPPRHRSGARGRAADPPSPQLPEQLVPDVTALEQADAMIDKAEASTIEALETSAFHRPAEDPLLRATMHIRSSLTVSTYAETVGSRCTPVGLLRRAKRARGCDHGLGAVLDNPDWLRPPVTCPSCCPRPGPRRGAGRGWVGSGGRAAGVVAVEGGLDATFSDAGVGQDDAEFAVVGPASCW